jgi:hypothetical protein
VYELLLAKDLIKSASDRGTINDVAGGHRDEPVRIGGEIERISKCSQLDVRN